MKDRIRTLLAVDMKAAEMMSAVCALLWGVNAALNPQIVPGLAALIELLPRGTWAFGFLMAALLQGRALYTNDARVRRFSAFWTAVMWLFCSLIIGAVLGWVPAVWNNAVLCVFCALAYFRLRDEVKK